MTKREARAIAMCRRKVLMALEMCEGSLGKDAAEYMHHYWGAHIRSAINGNAYGSAPIDEAEQIITGKA